jgi:hypothetical protein
MMKGLTVFVFAFLFGFSSSAQELVFSEPIKLSSNVNSEDEELGVVLSSDGKTMYFSRAFHDKNRGGKYAGTDIWMSKKDDEGNWMPAANVGSPWNNKQSNSVIGINQDNTIVYLSNAYSNKSGIAFSKLINGTWSDPEVIPIPGINRNDFVGFYVNPAFDVILISMKGEDSFGEEDLYVSLKDASEKWMEPKNLGPTINTKGFEISPFLSSDKKRLFFSSNGHGGSGDADIFVCDRLFDSWETWSVPKNLGDKLNTINFDAYFVLNDSIGYFMRSIKSERSDFYSAKIKQPDKFVKVETTTQYLSDNEVNAIIGFEPLMIFDQGEDQLTEKHKMILKKVYVSIVNQSGVRCTLIALKPPGRIDLEIYQNRLFAALDYLRVLGLQGSRVSLGLAEETNSEKECIRIKLSK